ncbi:hypothetical protein QYF36_021318 [Acer negundo]|nr:hypothetical protein QYF36_021318 [Acer negundo]
MSQKDDIVSTEAVRERKAARQPRSGETSRGNDATQLIDREGEKVNIVIHKRNAGSKDLISISLEEKFKSLDKALMEEELKLSLENFILDSINAPPGLYIENEKNFRQLQLNKPVLHLLDLLRTVLIQQINPHIGVRERLRQILIRILGKKVFNKLTFKNKHVWHSSFRNIEELIAAGISLKVSCENVSRLANKVYSRRPFTIVKERLYLNSHMEATSIHYNKNGYFSKPKYP